MLDYPMVDFVALRRAALTTPFLKTICLHLPAVGLHFSFLLTFGPLVLMMDMIQGGNRMVFVLEGTVENFSQIFFSLENFQIF